MRFLAVTVAAVCLLLGGATTALGAQKGVTTDLTWGITSADMTTEASVVADSGAQWAETDVWWPSLEPTQGTYDPAYLSTVDRAISLLRGTGARIIVNVAGAPSWETGTNVSSDPPKNPADFGKVMGFLAARYAGQVAAWQVWDEPNFYQFWTNPPDYAGYDALVKASYPAIKAADPNALVLFGGLSYNDYSFVEGAYAASPDIGRFYDVMSLHPYTAHGAPPEDIQYNADGSPSMKSFPTYRVVHSVMASHGDNKPIWLTEFGWATLHVPQVDMGGVDPATQADYLTRAYKFLEQDPYVQVALWYQLRNEVDGNDTDQWVYQLGLTSTTFSPKPAYFAFKSYVPPQSTGASTSSSSTGSAGTLRPQGSAAHALSATRTALTVRTRRSKGSNKVRISMFGQVSGARGGTVTLVVERAVGRRWKIIMRTSVAADRLGRFGVAGKLSVARSWRVRALYAGGGGYRSSLSPFTYVHSKR